MDRLKEMASKYIGDPCRVCNQIITRDDVIDGLIFAGYSSDGESRAAHSECWERFLELYQQYKTLDGSLPPQRNWTPVTERLPEPSETENK